MSEMPKLQPVRIDMEGIYPIRMWRWLAYIREWVLLEDWYFILPDKKTKIVIPAGFDFDGASIPRPFWSILSPVGLLLIPGLVHDYAYRHAELIQVTEDGNRIPYKPDADRAYWDRLFKDISIAVNGFAITTLIAWLVLKLLGWRTWNKYRT